MSEIFLGQDVADQIKAQKYKPITSKEDFVKRLAETCNMERQMHKKRGIVVHDVFGRAYMCKSLDDVEKIQLDNTTWEATKVVAGLLI